MTVSINPNALKPVVGPAGSVWFQQSGTGSVPRSSQDKMRESVSVLDFGAKGVSAAVDTAAIQSACNSLPAGGGDVIFPDIGTDFLLSDNINVPAGVNLVGPGSVRRTHGLSVNNYAFTLNGGNKIRGLTYDGGALSIVSPGVAQSIKDFFCINGDVEFDGGLFSNSCGSYIGFANEQFATTDTLYGLTVRGVTFGDYFDHAIYCQGYSTVVTGAVNICNNIFKAFASTTTRQAVKIKNITGATVANNQIVLPNGIFITVETGLDFPVVASDTTGVVVSGNTGSCVKFFESVCATDANNTSFMVRNLTIGPANVVKCTGYPVSLGLVASGGSAFATRASGVRIYGNMFDAPFGLNINGDMVSSGIDNLTIDENTLIISSALTALNIWGNVKNMVFARNTCVMNTAYASGNAIWNNDNLVGVSGQTAYIPNAACTWDISDNVLLGNFGCLIAEQPASAVTALIGITCLVRGNRNVGANSSKREVVFTSSVLASATSIFYLENNRSIGGTTSSNVCSVASLLSGLHKIGSGATGLSIQPNTSGNGVSLYNTSVTPDATNFALQTTGALSILNGTSAAILQVQNSTKLSASSSGIAITGALATGGAASTLASSGTITPTGIVHFVSGTTAISTITPPTNISGNSGLLVLIPTGAFTLATGGNIAVASTAVVNKPMLLVYDTSAGGRWYPSY